MQPTLVILAAGAGSRYGGLKQLAPIGPSGETLLEYSAFDALRSGFGDIVLVIRRDAEPEFRDRLGSGLASRAPVRFVHQRLTDLPGGLEPPADRHRPWGTGQAVLTVEPAVRGPFAVVNADDFYGRDSYTALAGFLNRTDGHTLAAVGFRVGDTLTEAGPVSRALLQVDNEGHLRTIEELLQVWEQDGRILYHDVDGAVRQLTGDELVSMNMWGLTPQLLPELRRHFVDFLARPEPGVDDEFLMPEVVQHLVREGDFRVEVLPSSGEWCGITFRADEERVAARIVSLIEQGRYPKELWA